MVSAALPSSIPPGHVLIRVAFAGVNASDVNFSAGRYQASIAEAQASLPFDAGFEAVGAVAAVGPQVSGGFLLLPAFTLLWCGVFVFGLLSEAPPMCLPFVFGSTHNVDGSLSHGVAVVISPAFAPHLHPFATLCQGVWLLGNGESTIR